MRNAAGAREKLLHGLQPRGPLSFCAKLQNKTNPTVESAGGSLSSLAALIGRGNAGNARGGREARREN